LATRGNAENLAEAVEGASPCVLQRVLTEARWDDAAATRRLQQSLAPRLTHPDAVWTVHDSGFPKQEKKSGGRRPAVLRRAGQGGQLLGGPTPGFGRSPKARGGAAPKGEL
jgi:SRSO17 transposase